MSSRRGVVAVSCWALMLATACPGGLYLDAGNAFPCDFSLGEPTRDFACSTGWVCGVTNQCQLYVDEGVPDGSVPPNFDFGTLIAPRVLDAGVRVVARDPTTFRLFVEMEDHRTIQIADAGALEVTSPGDFSQAIEWGIYRGVLLDGGAVRIDVGLPSPGTYFVDAGSGTTVQELRIYPGPPAPPLQLIYTQGALNALLTAQYTVSDGGLRTMPSPGLTLLDARPLPSELLGLSASEPYTTVGVMVAVADVDRKPQLYYFGPPPAAGPDAWNALEDPAAPAVKVTPNTTAQLRHSTNGEVWAAVFSDSSFGTGSQLDVLAVWQLGFFGGGAQISRAWKDCTPCQGTVRGFQPVFNGSVGVEVICEAPDGISRSTVTVQGSAARTPLDACDTVPLDPPFDLSELMASDTAMSGGLALGGASGQLWQGDRVSTLTPVFLDRVPDAIGSAKLSILGGPSSGYTLPFSSSFFAVGTRGNDFPAFPATKDGVPRAPIGGSSNWLVTDGARIIKLQPLALTSSSIPYQVLFGPRLLDGNGAPSASPYNGAAVGDAGLFVVSGADSLYIYPVGTLRAIPFVDPLEDLTPQLTPQSGAPIRSLSVDPLPADADGDAGVYGYAISGSALFRFSRAGAPEHWDSNRINLSASEPVKVWSVDDGRTLGRVAFRDGSVFTLPSGLPMVEPLPTDQSGKSNRALDFESVDGYPICFSERGLYLAQAVAGKRTMTWARVPANLTLAASFIRPQAGKLSRGPDGSLLLFLDRGRVYAFQTQ